jgi:SAM-dependent MidA family methyltransferase
VGAPSVREQARDGRGPSPLPAKGGDSGPPLSDFITPLDDRIRDAIRADGPLRFDRFMDLALFAPGAGYYAGDRARIGRDGDFYPNVSVGRMFGRVLAEQFAEIDALLGAPRPFSIVEQGANDGAFARDVLDALGERHPDLCARTRCVLVEPFPRLEARQRATLAGHAARTEWASSLDALAPFAGVHFSNEFADALPVRLFVRHAGRWLERHVTTGPGALAFADLAISDPADAAHLPADAADGYVAELRPAAGDWMRGVARALDRGIFLTVDYGHPRELLHAPWRRDGTLACYHAHRRDGNPLASPGEKDITAHVDFTALIDAGRAAGLTLAGFTDQCHFLVGAAETLLRELESTPDTPRRSADLRALKTLLHPEIMGTQFKCLALAKGLPAPRLSGFKFARS